jgi:hypothetical protein
MASSAETSGKERVKFVSGVPTPVEGNPPYSCGHCRQEVYDPWAHGVNDHPNKVDFQAAPMGRLNRSVECKTCGVLLTELELEEHVCPLSE